MHWTASLIPETLPRWERIGASATAVGTGRAPVRDALSEAGQGPALCGIE
jgi:hypothetical protein